MNTLKKPKQNLELFSSENKRKQRYRPQTASYKEYFSHYSERLGIQVLFGNYQPKENKQEDERESVEGLLETLIKKALGDKEQIEESPQESNIASLENILRETKKDKYITRHKYPEIANLQKHYKYAAYLNIQATSHRINQESGAHVFYVPSSALPSGVLGMYIPSLHTYYVANDLSEEEMEWVDYHEEYHSIYGAGEAQADAYATGKLGYNPFAPRNYSLAA